MKTWHLFLTKPSPSVGFSIVMMTMVKLIVIKITMVNDHDGNNEEGNDG